MRRLRPLRRSRPQPHPEPPAARTARPAGRQPEQTPGPAEAASPHPAAQTLAAQLDNPYRRHFTPQRSFSDLLRPAQTLPAEAERAPRR